MNTLGDQNRFMKLQINYLQDRIEDLKESVRRDRLVKNGADYQEAQELGVSVDEIRTAKKYTGELFRGTAID